MTDAQAKQINEMRMKGMGYKAIGMAIGLSRDIVRNYCKRHNLAGYATVVSKKQGGYKKGMVIFAECT